MILSVRKSPLQEPLLVTQDASWLDIRDDEGHLIMFIIFPPGKKTFITCTKGDSDFDDTAKSFSIPLKI